MSPPQDGHAPKVGAKWLMLKALGVDQKWTRKLVVVFEDGTMKLFEDEAASKETASFDLKLWTTENVVTTETASSWRITMESDEGAVQFGFESAAESNEVMEWMMRFIVDDEERANEDGGILAIDLVHFGC